MFKGVEGPKELIRERKLPDDGTVEEMGRFVNGYSFCVGPDGKPIVREFGNVKPSMVGDLSVRLGQNFCQRGKGTVC